MSDYISREAALKSLCKAACNVQNCECDRVRCPEWFAIHYAPAADVRPNVTGRWEEVEVTDISANTNLPVTSIVSMRCSECNRYHNEVYYYGCATENVHFCPNCGAKMEAGE